MIRVQAHSRLHFGLINPFSGLPRRRFGGVGLMIREPELRLLACPAASWSAEGPQAERALKLAKQFAAGAPTELVRPHRLIVEAIAPEHVGLGSGTQLALAVGRALSTSWGWEGLDACALAQCMGRGQRSAIGIHGFQWGGFLVDAGKNPQDAIAPLVDRLDFPEEWRMVLAIPRDRPGLHGAAELEAFERLGRRDTDLALVERLSRLALHGLVPTLRARDLQGFGEALFDFNCHAGEAFASVQGNVYAATCVDAFTRFFRGNGVRGVAQSSWGPTVAALAGTEDQAIELVDRARNNASLPPAQIFATQGRNRGAEVSYEPDALARDAHDHAP